MSRRRGSKWRALAWRLPLALAERIDRFGARRIDLASGCGKFVVFTSGRSGSNFFLSLINQHPQITCFSELYHPDTIFVGEDCSAPLLQKRPAYWLRELFPRLFIIGLWRSRRSEPMVGFKHIWFHTGRIRETALLHPQVKKVFLTRRNVLRMEVSRQIADKTREWIRFVDTEKRERIHFDLSQFWRHYERGERQIADLKRSLEERGQGFCEIYYEDLLSAGREAALGKLVAYLGVAPWAFDVAAVKTKRQNPYALRALVTNYDELEGALRGTGAEWMLREDER